MKAIDLAELLRDEVFDLKGAADYLGLEKNSVEYAVYRGRLPAVQFGAKKLFTKDDLKQYKARRGKGKSSELEDVKLIVV